MRLLLLLLNRGGLSLGLLLLLLLAEVALAERDVDDAVEDVVRLDRPVLGDGGRAAGAVVAELRPRPDLGGRGGAAAVRGGELNDVGLLGGRRRGRQDLESMGIPDQDCAIMGLKLFSNCNYSLCKSSLHT